MMGWAQSTEKRQHVEGSHWIVTLYFCYGHLMQSFLQNLYNYQFEKGSLTCPKWKTVGLKAWKNNLTGVFLGIPEQLLMEVYILEHWNIISHSGVMTGVNPNPKQQLLTKMEVCILDPFKPQHRQQHLTILNIFICFPRLPLLQGMKLKYAARL